jgi:hypothetical protein
MRYLCALHMLYICNAHANLIPKTLTFQSLDKIDIFRDVRVGKSYYLVNGATFEGLY